MIWQIMLFLPLWRLRNKNNKWKRLAILVRIVRFSNTVHVNLLMNTDIHLHQTVPARILSIKTLTLNFKL